MNRKRKIEGKLLILSIVISLLCVFMNNSIARATVDDEGLSVTLNCRLESNSSEVYSTLMPIGSYTYWETPELDTGIFEHDNTRFNIEKVQYPTINTTSLYTTSNITENTDSKGNCSIPEYSISTPKDTLIYVYVNYTTNATEFMNTGIVKDWATDSLGTLGYIDGLFYLFEFNYGFRVYDDEFNLVDSIPITHSGGYTWIFDGTYLWTIFYGATTFMWQHTMDGTWTGVVRQLDDSDSPHGDPASIRGAYCNGTHIVIVDFTDDLVHIYKRGSTAHPYYGWEFDSWHYLDASNDQAMNVYFYNHTWYLTNLENPARTVHAYDQEFNHKGIVKTLSGKGYQITRGGLRTDWIIGEFDGAGATDLCFREYFSNSERHIWNIDVNITYQVLGLNYTEILDCLTLSTTRTEGALNGNQTFYFDSSMFAHYNYTHDLTIIAQNMTFIFNSSYDFLGHAECLNVSIFVNFSINEWRVPSEVNMIFNSEYVTDESYNSGYASFSSFLNTLIITADLTVYFELESETFFTLTFDLDTISRTYLCKDFQLLSDHNIVIDDLELSSTLDLKKVYLNNIELSGAGNVYTANELMLTNNIFTLEIILGSEAHLLLNHIYNTLTSGISTIFLQGTTNTLTYFGINRFDGIHFGFPTGYNIVQGNFTISNVYFKPYYVSNSSNDLYGNGKQTASIHSEYVQWNRNYTLSNQNGVLVGNNSYPFIFSRNQTALQPSSFTLINGTSDWAGKLDSIDGSFTTFESTQEHSFSDSFDDGLPGDWYWYDGGSACSLSESGGNMNIACSTGARWLGLDQTFPPTGGYISMESGSLGSCDWEISTGLTGSPGQIRHYAGIIIMEDTNNVLFWGTRRDSMTIYRTQLTYLDQVSIWGQEASSSYVYYRVRKIGDTMYYDACNDGVSWVNYYSDNSFWKNIDLSDAEVGIAHWTWGSASSWTSSFTYCDFTKSEHYDFNSTIVLHANQTQLTDVLDYSQIGLHYSHMTDIQQTVNLSVWNNDINQWDLINSSANHIDFYNGFYHLNSSHINSTDDIKLRYNAHNDTNTFEFYLDRLKCNFTYNISMPFTVNSLTLDDTLPTVNQTINLNWNVDSRFTPAFVNISRSFNGGSLFLIHRCSLVNHTDMSFSWINGSSGFYYLNISFEDIWGNWITYNVNYTLYTSISISISYQNPVYIGTNNTITVNLFTDYSIYKVYYHNSTDYVQEYKSIATLHEYEFNFTVFSDSAMDYNISIFAMNNNNDSFYVNISALQFVERASLIDILNLKGSYLQSGQMNALIVLYDSFLERLASEVVNYTITAPNGTIIVNTSQTTNANGNFSISIPFSIAYHQGFYHLNASYNGTSSFLGTWKMMSFEIYPIERITNASFINLTINGVAPIGNLITVNHSDNFTLSHADNATFDLSVIFKLNYTESYSYGSEFTYVYTFGASSDITTLTMKTAEIRNYPSDYAYYYYDSIESTGSINGTTFRIDDALDQSFINADTMSLRFVKYTNQVVRTQLTATPSTDTNTVSFSETLNANRSFGYWYYKNVDGLTINTVSLYSTRTGQNISSLTQSGLKYYFNYNCLAGDQFRSNLNINPNWNIKFYILKNNGTYSSIQIQYCADLTISNVALVLDLTNHSIYNDNWTNSATQSTIDDAIIIPNLTFTSNVQTIILNGTSATPRATITGLESDQNRNRITVDTVINFAAFLEYPKFTQVISIPIQDDWTVYKLYYGDEKFTPESISDNSVRVISEGFDREVKDSFLHFSTKPFKVVDFDYKEDGNYGYVTITINSTLPVEKLYFHYKDFELTNAHELVISDNDGLEISDLTDQGDYINELYFKVKEIPVGESVIKITVNFATPFETFVQMIFPLSVLCGLIGSYYYFKKNDTARERLKKFVNETIVDKIRDKSDEKGVENLIISTKENKIYIKTNEK